MTSCLVPGWMECNLLCIFVVKRNLPFGVLSLTAVSCPAMIIPSRVGVRQLRFRLNRLSEAKLASLTDRSAPRPLPAYQIELQRPMAQPSKMFQSPPLCRAASREYEDSELAPGWPESAAQALNLLHIQFLCKHAPRRIQNRQWIFHRLTAIMSPN